MFNFAEHLKMLRLQHGKTQREVSIAINITDRNYAKFEHGEVKPSFYTLIALADFFDVSTDYLMGRSDDPTRR